MTTTVMGMRSARLDEITTFYELWQEYLDEHPPASKDPEAKAKALAEAGRLFHLYVSGSKNGSCHFWVDEDDAPQGVFLTGEPLSYFDTFDIPDKCNIMYGIYIRAAWRDGKASAELVGGGAKVEVAKGFTTGVTRVRAGNEKPMRLIKEFGAKLLDQRFSCDLKSAAKLGDSK